MQVDRGSVAWGCEDCRAVLDQVSEVFVRIACSGSEYDEMSCDGWERRGRSCGDSNVYQRQEGV